MNKSWILGSLLIAAGGYGIIRAVTFRPPITKNSKILLIGDSHACGLRPHFQTFAKEMKVPFEYACQNGTRVDQWSDSSLLESALTKFKPTHVFLSLGTNDEYSLLKEEAIEESAKKLIEKVKKANAYPIWIGPPTLPNKKPLHCLETMAPYYFNSRNYTIPRGPDNIHPTIKGYAGWAALIWNWLS